MDAAQTVVRSEPISAGIFALIALGLFVFAAYMVVQASLDNTYLRTLRYVLAGLSFTFAAALGYEAASVATHFGPTISVITRTAFGAHPFVWVIVFSVLMAMSGALALHFTRVAHPASNIVHVQRLIGGAHPLIWAVVFAVAIVVVSQLVSRLTPIVARPGPEDPGFSWWVLFLGGATYAAGALIAWVTNWRP